MRSPIQRSVLLCLPFAVSGASSVFAQDAPTGPADSGQATGLVPHLDELTFGGLLRASLDYSSDDIYEMNGERLSGVRFQDAQLWVEAKTGIFDVRVMAKAADSNAFPPTTDGDVDALEVRDAWIRGEVGDGVHVYAGKYKCPLVASANVDYGSLMMIDRTRIGQFFAGKGAYQNGAAVTFDNEQFHAKLALQNGADGVVDAYGVVARGELKLGGGAGYREGAFGAPDDWAATFGLGYFNDGSQIGGDDFGSAIALDAYATMAAFSVHAEILDMDEELASRTVGNMSDDATAFSATVGYLFRENMEIALRIQDLDDEADTTLVGAGYNYYLSGHDAKVQVNISQFDQNDEDGLLLQVGFAVGFGKRF